MEALKPRQSFNLNNARVIMKEEKGNISKEKNQRRRGKTHLPFQSSSIEGKVTTYILQGKHIPKKK